MASKDFFRLPVQQINLPNSSSAEVTTTLKVEGIIGTICLNVSEFTNGSVTVTISIRDEDSFVLYSSATIPDNTLTVKTGVDIIAHGLLTIGITPSGDPGADETVDIVLYGVKRGGFYGNVFS